MKKTMAVLLAAALALFALGGCKKEGAAEKAGRKIDDAFKSAKEKLGN